MTSETPVNAVGFPDEDEYEVVEVVWSDGSEVPETETSTRLPGRLIDRFQMVLLPFAAAAAIAAPSRPIEIRRVLSRAASSQTQSLDVQWLLEEWAYTTETASLAEVQALNRLLALPAAEGLVLDHPDDQLVYSDLWSPGLRQGDIVGPIIFPLISRDITILAAAPTLTGPAPGQPFTQIIVRGESRLAAVVSHDCEFNEEKRNKLLIARIQDVPGNLSDEERERLRASNDVEALLSDDPDARIAGVDSFVLAPLAGVFGNEQVVVFTTITALPMKMKDDLLGAKRAELVQADRVRLRQKLAWFFGRGGDDVPEAEKSQPPTMNS